jgi:hypothetical protein
MTEDAPVAELHETHDAEVDGSPSLLQMVKQAVIAGDLEYDGLIVELKSAMQQAEKNDLALVVDKIRQHKFAYTDVRAAFATRHTKRETQSCPLCKSEPWNTVKGP